MSTVDQCNGSGMESDNSNSSPENDVSQGTSEDEVDSGDSSDLDEDECESRRSQLLQHVQDLESQFHHLREQLYRERITQVENQLAEVKAGRSIDYLGPLASLQENMRIRIEVAGILRQMRITNIQNQFEGEEQAALQNFISEKALACESYYSELMETIRKLEEDRHNSEITWADTGDWGNIRAKSRCRRKAVTVSGPYIVYMLSSQDILDDWKLIKQAISRC